MRQRTRPIWRANRAIRTQKTVGDIEASIVALNDEDLLDLHDIFVPFPSSALAKLAADEMRRRNLSPENPG
jgi:hypothetical protein